MIFYDSAIVIFAEIYDNMIIARFWRENISHSYFSVLMLLMWKLLYTCVKWTVEKLLSSLLTWTLILSLIISHVCYDARTINRTCDSLYSLPPVNFESPYVELANETYY
jgi:hypothetical protein